MLSLEHRTLVPSLNFKTANPYACLDERRLKVQTRTEPWPEGELVAGVSSFGMGGTNVHVVLGAADVRETSRPSTERACVLPISARSVPAVDALEVRYAELLSSRGIALGDVAHSASTRRDHHDHRRAIVMRSATDVAYSVSRSVVPGRTYKLMFVLPDNVACEASSGSELAGSEPVFREAMQRSLDEGATRLVAFQSALAALWRAFGFEPDEVVHVSSGETAKIAASVGPDGTVFVELSPRPVMLNTLRWIFERAGVPGAAIPSMVPEFGERASILRAIAEMYCLGFDIDWKRLDVPNARFVPLGSYPWQKEYSWLELAAPTAASVLPQGVVVPSWIRASTPASRPSPSSVGAGEWLVFGDGGAAAKALVTRFAHHGYRARMVGAVEELASSDAVHGVVQFCEHDLGATVRLVQALGRRGEAGSPRLWLVTRGACVVDLNTSLAALASSQVWGLGRVAVNEHPWLRCTLVDLSPTETATDVDMLFAELSSDGGELEIAIRGTDRYVARLDRQPLATSKSRLQLRSDAAYLVTGGLGGLGLAAAGRLVDRGARTLVLLSRGGVATEEASAAVAKLVARGANVIVERADVSDRNALAEVLRRHRVRGVIHAAGVMAPAMIAAIDSDNLSASLAAKVDGARHLHELLAAEPLEFFVLYSSVATLLGMPGQGVYAAGNAYLDALAEHRRAIGLCATSVGWTVIENTGMAANAGEKAIAQLVARGVSSLPLRSATDLLEHFLGAGTPAHLGAVNFDLRRWTTFYPHAKSMPRLQPLADEKTSHTDGTVPQNLGALEQTDRIRWLETYLCKVAAEVLHHSGTLSPDRLLLDLGIDSLTALELQTMVEEEFAITMSSERFLRGPSLRELATEIAALFGGEASTVEARVPLSLHAEVELDEAITFAPREGAPPRVIFLTGATGFLGAFVLAELLEHTNAAICCLVRGQSAGEGMHRLEGILGRYDLSLLSLAARVTCIPGDLAKPRLGLGAEDYDRLASSVDTIVHSGASVNFVFPYEGLKASNVGGTHEVLRLASAARARLHYVSTIGVFPGGPGHLDRVFEDARPKEPDRLALGYMRAKWVAEALVMQARERGLDVLIYRPGTISGHSTSGAFNPDDFVCAMIKGCIELGVAPHVDTTINLVPVDYVSRALVRIALGAGGSSGAYHLVGQQPVAWTDVVAWIRALGYRLEEMPYTEWRQILVERAVTTGNALAPLLPLFVDHDSTDWLHLPHYDNARATRALVGTGVACPAVDASLVRRYVERFVVSGYLPRPR
ncbi:MAG TPA: thioester reductase domain-containing protein [Polyangiaceae bacterium]|nr:thioester reductase domain-containing protein [Polyangiaceae bacterium]